MADAGNVPSAAPPGNEQPRRAPLIIRVPLPGRSSAASKAIWIVLATLFATGAAVFIVLAVTLRGWGGLTVAGFSILIAIALIVGVAQAQRQRKAATAARQAIEIPPGSTVDPVAAALMGKLKRSGQAVGANVVLEAIRAAPIPKPPRARIVCLGDIAVPQVGDLRFEPVIITPTRFLWKRLWFVPAALALFAFWLVQSLGLLPIPGRIPLGGFAYLLVMGVMVGCVWVWRAILSPTYLRLAPGMVQVVQFAFSKSRPTIRSYPMQPGTVVIIQGARAGGQGHAVTIARGANIDEIPLWQMQSRADAAERLWEALLSTAPTPPLSDEDLVG